MSQAAFPLERDPTWQWFRVSSQILVVGSAGSPIDFDLRRWADLLTHGGGYGRSMIITRITSFLAGMLIANSSPHLATLVTGREHMTPLAGRNSGPIVNGAWAGINLAAGVALLQPSRRHGGRRWSNDLPAFELGCLTFAGWMAVTETFPPKSSWTNHR